MCLLVWLYNVKMDWFFRLSQTEVIILSAHQQELYDHY